MRGGRVTDLVHALHDCVQGSVIAYCGVSTVQVIVNGPGNADARHVEFLGEDLRSGKGTVSADDDESVNTMRTYIVICLLPAFRSHEILRTGCLQYCSSALDGTADTL